MNATLHHFNLNSPKMVPNFSIKLKIITLLIKTRPKGVLVTLREPKAIRDTSSALKFMKVS